MRKDHSKLGFLSFEQQNTVGYTTYEKIKHDIIFGNLEPGAKLKLDTLKVIYATSVSTLREILNRLASDGFVSAAEQRGFFVTPVSQNDLSEIANLRILLECHACLLRMEMKTGRHLVAAYHKQLIEGRMQQNGDTGERALEKIRLGISPGINPCL